MSERPKCPKCNWGMLNSKLYGCKWCPNCGFYPEKNQYGGITLNQRKNAN